MERWGREESSGEVEVWIGGGVERWRCGVVEGEVGKEEGEVEKGGG